MENFKERNNGMDIKVTVYSACYNQKDTIKKCIESVLAQKTNFKFEFIIKDDASNDGTKEIVEEYAKKYPEIIKPVFEVENRFKKHEMMEAFYETIKKAKGEYLAFCEGDDYWVNTDKLQKQVDFLDNNPEFSGCFHRIIRKNIKDDKKSYYLPSDIQISSGGGGEFAFGIEGVLKNYCVGILSCMFRIQKYKEDFLNTNAKCIVSWDTYLIYYFALKGKIKYLKNVTAVSVMGESNIWNNITKSIDYRNANLALEIINFPIEVRKLFDCYNCSLSYETPEGAMRRVFNSAITLGRFDIISLAAEKFLEIFQKLIAPNEPNYGYYIKKIRKYKKRNLFLLIFCTVLVLSLIIAIVL